MPSPHKRRSSGRVIVSSPLGSGRRRSGRLSIVSKPTRASNVKVCIRIRPLTSKEGAFRDGKEVVEIMDDRVLVFDPMEVHAPSFHKGRPTRDPTARRNRDLKFSFGRVFGPQASNQEIFEDTTKETLDNLMKGINCSVFAYGATGAGKTFTMLGTPTNKGVIARTVHELYERIDAIKDSVICDVEVSYLEIYNETARDLLNQTGKELILQEGNSGGVVIKGLSFHTPDGMDDLFRMLETGNSNRTQHPTDANKESSRSHAVFHIYLKQRSKTADVATDVTMSKMALIDLAGSERAAATANCGMRFREGANINKSLLALGNCINALAEGKGKNFVPFRQSKLTRILKDSLGGNCQTVMIAAVSSSAMSYDDTYNTLKYADRAQKIKLDLKSNVYRVEHSIHEYGKIVEELQSELRDMKQKVEVLELEKRRLQRELNSARQNAFAAELAREPGSGGDGRLLDEQQMQQMVDAVSQYTKFQNDLLQLDSQRSLVQMKLAQRERSHMQLLDVLVGAEKKESARHRFEKFRHQSQTRIDQLAGQVMRFDEAIRDMKQAADEIFKSVTSSQHNGHAPTGKASISEGCRMLIDAIKDRSEMCQMKATERHLKEIVDCLLSRTDNQDKVIEAMGSLLREQYLLLQSLGYASPSINTRFENVEKILDCNKVVTWGDQNGHDGQAALVELRDCTIRKFGIKNGSFIVQHPVNGHAALQMNGAGDGPGIVGESSAAAANHFVPMAVPDFRNQSSTMPRLRFGDESTAAAAYNGGGASSETEDESVAPIPGTPPKGYCPSVKPKGTPYRGAVSSSSDDAEDGLSDKPGDKDVTFTMDDDHHNGHELAMNGAPMTGAGVDVGDEFRSKNGCANTSFTNGAPKFAIGGPDVGRPSLPAWRNVPRLPPRSQNVDNDGFKKPPIPERLNKPKMEKPIDGTVSGARPKVAAENSAAPLVRKPSVTSVRNSPMMRSPSQSSLTNGQKKTPELPGNVGASVGNGLRRAAASSSNLQQWRY